MKWIFILLIGITVCQIEVGAASSKTPPVQDVFRVAIRAAGLEASQVTRWRQRARKAPLLPRLQVDFDRNVRNQLNVNLEDSVAVNSSGVTIGPQSSSQQIDADDDLSVGVKAVWYLDQLLFSRDDLDISAESRALSQERERLLAQVRKIYFLREEKLRNRSSQLDVEELTAALDAYTEGWFSMELQNHEAN